MRNPGRLPPRASTPSGCPQGRWSASASCARCCRAGSTLAIEPHGRRGPRPRHAETAPRVGGPESAAGGAGCPAVGENDGGSRGGRRDGFEGQDSGGGRRPPRAGDRDRTVWQQAGYDVVDADNGDEAILKAREQRPELALLDIRMEGKSGFDVAEYLRDVARIPFMFLSAFADEETVAKIRELGAVAYLVKPLDVEQILPTVDAAFAKLRAGQLEIAGPGRRRRRPRRPPPDPLADPLPLAVGVLMHRHSLSREAARQRLQRMAAEQRVSRDRSGRAPAGRGRGTGAVLTGPRPLAAAPEGLPDPTGGPGSESGRSGAASPGRLRRPVPKGDGGGA
ncbi:MAG: response regulator [Comamonadaceae bacterium]|nr:response regulator [Comamonadaceae bacterium]